jgi:hypothetical protein
MSIPTLLWLFPIAFMLHDFEEVIFFEPWLKHNAPDIKAKLEGRLPAFAAKRIDVMLTKTTSEFALSVCLIFILVSLSSFIAVEFHRYGFFLAASTAFFLHTFMHIGQAVALRRYVPALATSLLIVLPYGGLLFPRLLAEGIVTLPGLLVYGLVGIFAIVPIIFVMHWLGENISRRGDRPVAPTKDGNHQ